MKKLLLLMSFVLLFGWAHIQAQEAGGTPTTPPYGTNLLQNNDGSQQLEHWIKAGSVINVLSNGWQTGYQLVKMTQGINLIKAGFSAEDLAKSYLYSDIQIAYPWGVREGKVGLIFYHQTDKLSQVDLLSLATTDKNGVPQLHQFQAAIPAEADSVEFFFQGRDAVGWGGWYGPQFLLPQLICYLNSDLVAPIGLKFNATSLTSVEVGWTSFYTDATYQVVVSGQELDEAALNATTPVEVTTKSYLASVTPNATSYIYVRAKKESITSKWAMIPVKPAIPLQVSSAAQWEDLRDLVAQNSTLLIELTNDFTLPADYAPLGTAEMPFRGSIQGNSHTITLQMTAPAENSALLGYADKTTFTDLTINGTVSSGFKYSAAFIGQNVGKTTFTHCTADVAFTFTEKGDRTSAMFVGLSNDSVIINSCFAKGSIKSTAGNLEGIAPFIGWCNTYAQLNHSMSITTYQNVIEGENLMRNSKNVNASYALNQAGKDWNNLVYRQSGDYPNHVAYMLDFTSNTERTYDWTVVGDDVALLPNTPNKAIYSIASITASTLFRQDFQMAGSTYDVKATYPGYKLLDDFTVKNASTQAPITVTNMQFVMPSANVYIGNYEMVPLDVIINTCQHGSVTADNMHPFINTKVQLTAHPDQFYEFISYTVKNASNATIPVTDGSFTMQAPSVTVSATFEMKAPLDQIRSVSDVNSITISNAPIQEGITLQMCFSESILSASQLSTASWQNLTTATHTFSNLPTSTSYYLYLRYFINENETSACQSYTISTTTALAKEAVFAEDFEENLTDNMWTVLYANNNPTVNTITLSSTKALNGSNSFRFSSYNSTSDYVQYLISKPFVLADSAKLSFGYIKNNTDREAFRVGYSATTANIDAFTWSDENLAEKDTWKIFEQTIPQTAKYFAIKYDPRASNYYLYVDSLRLEVYNEIGTALTPATSNLEARIYPNPTADELHIAFPAAQSNIVIRVIDLSGRTVITTALNADATGTVTLPVSQLAAGTYLLQAVTPSGDTYKTRFIKE